MVGKNISFAKEKNGYDRAQVDSYIKKISDAYETTYYEFLDVSGKYKSLMEERESSGSREETGMNADVAAKTLINTEMLAQKIIADAQAEANSILEKARKSVDEANAEAAGIKEDARKALDGAVSEAAAMAAQTREDIEKARRIIDSASSQVEELLTFRMKDEKETLAA